MTLKKKYLLQGFEPQNVLRHFEDICSIPHGTGHEAALRSHIKALAEKNSLSWEQDPAGNLLVHIPASEGCASAAPFLIQGHMDMVLAKEPRVEKDPEKEPVKLILEGNLLRADGTTLGADNAVGLCHMMALMEQPCPLRHPPLELLFTVEEEDGLSGIRKADLSRIRSRRMLNMDCGDPDCLVIGSAGGSKYQITADFPLFPVLLSSGQDMENPPGLSNLSTHVMESRMESLSSPSGQDMQEDSPGQVKQDLSGQDMQGLCVEIHGLRGGHSGIEAGKNRASSLELGGRLLSALCDHLPVRIHSLDSPPAAGGFPRWMKLVIFLPGQTLQEAELILSRLDTSFREEIIKNEPDYQMTVSPFDPNDPHTRQTEDFPVTADEKAKSGGGSGDTAPKAITGDCEISAASVRDTRALADFLLLVSFDALRRDTAHPDRVLCSALLTGACFRDGIFSGSFSIRANRESYREAAAARLQALCRLTGMQASLRSQPTPPWIENYDSPLLETCQSVYRDLFGQEMRVQVENGSVEVSVITSVIPDMDAIGFAPKSRGAHTTDEHLYLDSMPVFWSLLTALLSRLCDQ